MPKYCLALFVLFLLSRRFPKLNSIQMWNFRQTQFAPNPKGLQHHH